MFDSLKNIGQLTQLMGKAQKIQSEMKNLQEQLATRRISGEAGGGRVTATVNGKMELIEVRIDRNRMDMANVDMVQDLVTAAVRNAQMNAGELVRQEMERLSADLGLPPEMLPQA